MHIYFAQWEWVTANGRSFWRPPLAGGPWVGALDLRHLPAQSAAGGTPVGFGCFGYNTEVTIPGSVYLGIDFNAVIPDGKLATLSAALGRTLPSGTTVKDVLWETLTTFADATGQAGPKPLRGNGGTVRLLLGGETVHEEAFEGAHVSRAIQVFQEDYRKVREAGELPSVLQRWAGATGIELLGVMTSVILPPEFVEDGVAEPHTILVEDWPTQQADLATNQAHTWTEVSQAWEVVTFASQRWATQTTTTNGTARCETALSSVDHYCQCIWHASTDPSSFNHQYGVTTRFAAAADTCYYLMFSSGGFEFGKRVAGTDTLLAQPILTGPSEDTNYAIKLSSEGDEHTATLDATVASPVTDTAITSGVRIGLYGKDNTGSPGTAGMRAVQAADLFQQNVLPDAILDRGGWTDTLDVATDAAVLAGLQAPGAQDAKSPANPTGSEILKVRVADLVSADGRFLRYGLKKLILGPNRVVNVTVQLRSPDGSTTLDEWVHSDISLTHAEFSRDISAETVSGQHQVWFIPSVS